MLRCVDILHDTSLNLLEWRRAYIVMFYANKTQHYSTWYYVKESLFCIKRDFIVIFDPQNMSLDNFKNKIYQILSEILTNSVFSVMAAVIGFLPILNSRFARLCT